MGVGRESAKVMTSLLTFAYERTGGGEKDGVGGRCSPIYVFGFPLQTQLRISCKHYYIWGHRSKVVNFHGLLEGGTGALSGVRLTYGAYIFRDRCPFTTRST